MASSRHKALWICLTVVCAGLTLAAHGATPEPVLISPLAAPRLATRTSHLSCERSPPPVSTLTSVHYYTDARNSVADEAKRAEDERLQQPVTSFIRYVTEESDAYMRTGETGHAACAAQWLDDWAQARALAETANAGGDFRRSWYLSGLAISWLKIRDTVAAEPRSRIDAWLSGQAQLIVAFYAQPDNVNNALNNHGDWAALAVAAAAAASNDRDLFAWAEQRFRTNLAQITPEGALPLEIARGQRALHYHLFALTPLVLMARFERANGRDDFDQAALTRLESFARTSLDDPRRITELAGAAQEKPTAKNDPSEWVWAALSQQPPSPVLKAVLQYRRPLIDPRCGGDVVLDWGYGD